jgi:hypothetical protein
MGLVAFLGWPFWLCVSLFHLWPHPVKVPPHSKFSNLFKLPFRRLEPSTPPQDPSSRRHVTLSHDHSRDSPRDSSTLDQLSYQVHSLRLSPPAISITFGNLRLPASSVAWDITPLISHAPHHSHASALSDPSPWYSPYGYL